VEDEAEKAIDLLCIEAFDTALKHGWHDRPRMPLEIHALIHSEISEATEAARTKRAELYFEPDAEGNRKPEGELVELADAVIRILDYCGKRSWPLGHAIRLKMEYNETRPYRHGGKLA
jgi:hypothetical protein